MLSRQNVPSVSTDSLQPVNLVYFYPTFPFAGSEKQKAGTERVLRFLIEKKKPQYDELAKKYDPEGIYIAKYKAEAEARGVKV